MERFESVSRSVTPAGIVATLYHGLGIIPNTSVYEFNVRPVGVSHDGQPIGEILA